MNLPGRLKVLLQRQEAYDTIMLGGRKCWQFSRSVRVFQQRRLDAEPAGEATQNALGGTSRQGERALDVPLRLNVRVQRPPEAVRWNDGLGLLSNRFGQLMQLHLNCVDDHANSLADLPNLFWRQAHGRKTFYGRRIAFESDWPYLARLYI